MTKYTDPISFYSLFEKEFQVDENTTSKIERVVIPQIQRDYAQGRKNANVTKIRDSFLNVLDNALCCDKPAKLDFIYGDISNGEMTPLDGQQRLTTLFLLHWYIAKHESKEDIECLSKFSYQTRFSSRDFCLNLIEYQPDFNKDNLSLDIKDQSWFVSSWSNDPTIDSMLVMIDAIHARFKDSGNLWEKLTAQDAPISFYFLPIKDMGLTDSLYIKMNSRGKALTPFEHFKAHFEKVIETVDKDLYKEFTHKIDNDWTDLLWIYRGGNNIIDDEFMRYYRFVTEVISYTKGYKIDDDEFILSERVYGIGNADAKDNLTYLFKALDCWIGVDIDKFFSSLFADKAYEDGKVKIYSNNSNLFLQCCNEYGEREGHRRRFTLNSTLLLYATLVYRLNCDSIDLTDLRTRIRIVRNLVFNSSDEIREERMKDQLNETKEIILHSQINREKGGYGYNLAQKEEESIKIEFRKAYPHLIETLNHLEDHYLLQGTARIINLSFG